MCGIAGYIGARQIADDAISECLTRMHRRGPDHAGSVRHNLPNGRHVVLLHSRLSIIDLADRAHQPFVVGDKSLIYNGELYNYIEIRDALRNRGVAFETESDTEVMLRAIDCDGFDALKVAEGMWAFAFFNATDGSVTLVRDRFGEKPLYIHRAADGLYFGSEPKFIFALLGRTLPVNVGHLYRYMVNGYRALYQSSDTFFEGLSELRPATMLRVTADGREVTDTYWQPAYNPESDMTYDEAVAGCRERLIDVVSKRLRSDVPLAFCMSGGVDSTGLISIAKRQFDYDVHGFTVVNEDERYNETQAVHQTVSELGIRHTPVPVKSENFLENLRELVAYHDSPVITISYYVHWLLMGHVSQSGYRISISGTGADELLSGYLDHHLMYLSEIKGRPEFDKALAGWRKNVEPHVRNPYLKDPDLFVRDPEFRDHIFLNNETFAGFLTNEWFEDFNENAYSNSLLRNRMMNEMFVEGVPVILHEDDLNAMFYSIENRSPYLDRDLFEFCYRIPNQYLMRDGYAKVVLRDALRGIAPDHVLDDPWKVGFNAPVESFVDLNDESVRDELLTDSPVYELVRRDRVAKLLGERDLPNSTSKFLFYFLNAKIFLEAYAS